MRLLCNGTIVEDIDQYNRIHEMFHILSSKENRVNDDVGNQNNRWDCDAVYGALVTPMSSPHNESVEQLTPSMAQAGLLNLAGDESKLFQQNFVADFLINQNGSPFDMLQSRLSLSS